MNVLIAGSTGLVGSITLTALLDDERIKQVIVLNRSKQSVFHQKIFYIQSELDKLDDVSLPVRIDAAVCAIGSTIKKAGTKEAFRNIDCTFVVNVARFALRHGCESFGVVSALGANRESAVFYNRVKGEMEQELVHLGFKRLLIVRPSLILGEREKITGDKRLGEGLFIKLSPIMNATLVGPLKKYRGVPAHQVAAHLTETVFNQMSGTTIMENSELLKI